MDTQIQNLVILNNVNLNAEVMYNLPRSEKHFVKVETLLTPQPFFIGYGPKGVKLRKYIFYFDIFPYNDAFSLGPSRIGRTKVLN